MGGRGEGAEDGQDDGGGGPGDGQDGGGGDQHRDDVGGGGGNVPKCMCNGDNGCFAASAFLLLIGIEVSMF